MPPACLAILGGDLQAALDQGAIEEGKLLEFTNTSVAKQLKSAWKDWKNWQALLALAADSFENVLDGFSAQRLREDDLQRAASVQDVVASMIATQALYRSLKPKEKREDLLKAVKETWLESRADESFSVELPTKLGMLFESACAAHDLK